MNQYENMVVIFIDLLGTKNNTNFSDKYFIHEIFHGEIKQNEKRGLDHVIYERKVFSFSDCAYIFYFYKNGIEEYRKNKVKLTKVALENTSVSLLRILNAGYLVRGGVAYGDAFIDDKGFFGPAVEEAYLIESKFANLPIIELSQELGKEIFENDLSEIEENKEKIELLFPNSVPTLIEKISDEKYFLNIFIKLEGISSSLFIENEILTLNEVKSNINKVINKDILKYVDNANILEKLIWMKAYLNGKNEKLNKDLFGNSFV